MIRRVILSTMVALIAPSALLAQVDFDQFTISSVQSYASFGLFKTALDGAGNVHEEEMGPGFSELENRHVFGGLSNINTTAAAGGAATVGIDDPLVLGLFIPGEVPWSVFSGTYFEDTLVDTDDTTVLGTERNETVTSGNTDTQYSWYESITEFDYDRVIADQFVQYAQFLTQLGSVNTGVRIGAGRENDYDTSDVYTRSRTYQFDSATAGAVPNPATDYTSTYTDEDYTNFDNDPASIDGLGKTTALGLEIPLYLRTGDVSHSGKVGATYLRSNESRLQSLEYSVPQDNTENPISTEAANDLTNFAFFGNAPTVAPNQFVNVPRLDSIFRITSVPVDATYALYTPLLGEHEDNRLMVRADAGVTINSVRWRRIEEWQLYDFTAGGERTANTAGEYSLDAQAAPALDWEAAIRTAHSFYYDISESMVFAVSPSVGGTLSRDIGYDGGNSDITDGITTADFTSAQGLLASIETVERSDNTNDGDFDDTADRIETVESSYEYGVLARGGIAGADRVDRTLLDVTLRVPATVTVQPPAWSFGVTLGSRPEVRFTRSSLRGRTRTTATETSLQDGGGESLDVALESERSDGSEEYRYTDWDWVVGAEHRIALNLMLPAGVSMDVALDLSTGLTNILDFNNLIVQTTVPLP